MKVLLSAYACEPGKGSEPEVGFRTLMAVAQEHDVWVVTRRNNLPSLSEALEDHPFRERIHLIGHDVPGILMKHKKKSRLLSHVYYDRWQTALSQLVVDLEKQVGFDVAHHVTFASYWTRAGIAAVSAPKVWGPVGGGVTTPLRLYGQLGVRGLLEESARSLIRPLYARMPWIRRIQESAAVVLVQNPETGSRISSNRPPIVLPNALAAEMPNLAAPVIRSRDVVTVGRLEPWKGTHLAIRAFAAAETRDSHLLVIGDGHELPRLQRLAAMLDVDDSVDFVGHIPRGRTLEFVARARVMVHAAIHEEAGWAVSEALSYGTPVICIDRGGPPILARQWETVPTELIRPESPKQTVEAMADALTLLLARKSEPAGNQRPALSYDRTVLEAYEQAAAMV